MLPANSQASLIGRVLLVVLTLSAGCAAVAQSSAAAQRGPLIVVLVVDQMRTEYLEKNRKHFTGGLRRLMESGTWFRRAAYPYLNTVTCAGHSTIGTGALPYRHGMVLNAWWDREAGRTRPCTADPSEKNIAYGGEVAGGDSADALLVPTLADRVHDRTAGRAVVFSLKPRSAIPLAGTKPASVVWYDDRAGWTTSTAFTGQPVAWLQEFFTAHPASNDRGKAWERALDPSAYNGDDAGTGERAPTGWTTTFPHRIGDPAEQFNAQWQRSPFADDYLGKLAVHALDTLDLGRGPGIDLLAVSFSTLDLVGHQFGPESHEVQDVVIRLDGTIGTLVDRLDARLGRSGYVLALSADHGVATLPEQTGASRVPSSEVIAAVNSALEPFVGPGKHVAHTAYTDIYLQPEIRQRLQGSKAALEAVLERLRSLRGVTHAFWAETLRSAEARASRDPVRRAAALSHHPARSGDIIIVPRENWLLTTSATSHGTLHWYDQGVPIIFFGAGVPAGVREEPATPADIAPTLAELAGLRFERTDGRPLLRRAPGSR